MGELVRLDVSENIGTITLDSQHNRNALSQQLVAELAECVEAAEAASTRAIVLRHEGPAFCAGADLKERAAGVDLKERAAGVDLKERAAATGPSDPSSASSPMVDVMRRLMHTPRPTIAAVDGAVRAGGIGLMAACDLVVVGSSVTFALTEVRIGVAAAIISVPILRRVPPAKIAAAMLTGEPFDATSARDMGLITHVTDDVPGVVAALCDGIRAGAPRAVAETKRLLHHVPTLDLDTAFDEMNLLSSELFNGPDAAEGMAAFREKRAPVWPD